MLQECDTTKRREYSRLAAEKRAQLESLLQMKAAAFLPYAQEPILGGKRLPDAVCGYARRENLFETMACTKTLYNCIDQYLFGGRNTGLPLRVRRRAKRNRQLFALPFCLLHLS